MAGNFDQFDASPMLPMSGLPVSFPRPVGNVAFSTLSGTRSNSPVSLYTPVKAGLFRACFFVDVITAGTAGSFQPLVDYSSDGHRFAN